MVTINSTLSTSRIVVYPSSAQRIISRSEMANKSNVVPARTSFFHRVIFLTVYVYQRSSIAC